MALCHAATMAVTTAITTGRRQLVDVRARSLLMAKWRVLWVVLGFALVAAAALRVKPSAVMATVTEKMGFACPRTKVVKA